MRAQPGHAQRQYNGENYLPSGGKMDFHAALHEKNNTTPDITVLRKDASWEKRAASANHYR
jgi:hypothetical protein